MILFYDSRGHSRTMGQAFESLRNHSEAVTPVAAFFVVRLKERTLYSIQKIQKT